MEDEWTDKEVQNFVRETKHFFDLLKQNPRILEPSRTHKDLYRGPINRLTEELAARYFGTLDPVGRMLNIDRKAFMVTGIMKKFPVNSHVEIKSLIPFIYLKSKGSNIEDWGNNSYYTYVLLDPKADLNGFNNKILELIKRHNKEAVTDIYLQPIGQIHLHSSGKYTAEIGAQGDIRYVRSLSLVAIFILLIACINFMNLSTAQSPC